MQNPAISLEIEFLEIKPEPWAFTAIIPGLGFLRDLYTDPFLYIGISRTIGRGPHSLPACEYRSGFVYGSVRRRANGGKT